MDWIRECLNKRRGWDMIIKCRMCGGDIQFNPGDTYGQCEYCGGTSTIPKGNDEQRLNRFNRANHFRRQCEFDKAIAAYEKILEEDDSDAEAHWGVVLSKYGIEYVEDPVSHERIPTCHRVQVSSILSDEDYQAALRNVADSYARDLYEKEAKRIAEIRARTRNTISPAAPPFAFFLFRMTVYSLLSILDVIFYIIFPRMCTDAFVKFILNIRGRRLFLCILIRFGIIGETEFKLKQIRRIGRLASGIRDLLRLHHFGVLRDHLRILLTFFLLLPHGGCQISFGFCRIPLLLSALFLLLFLDLDFFRGHSLIGSPLLFSHSGNHRLLRKKDQENKKEGQCNHIGSHRTEEHTEELHNRSADNTAATLLLTAVLIDHFQIRALKISLEDQLKQRT